jgi:hypothetical protein
MSLIKQTFVGYQPKYKIYIKYIFGFCSYISSLITIFSRNWHRLFVLSWLMSGLTSVFLLHSLLMTNWYLFLPIDISKIFLCFMSENTQLFIQICPTKHQTYLQNQLNDFWKWNNRALTKYHTGDSAEMDKNYVSIVRGLRTWNSETCFIKTLTEDSTFFR